MLRWGVLLPVACSHQHLYVTSGEMSTVNHLFLKGNHQKVGSEGLGDNSVLAEMRETNSLRPGVKVSPMWYKELDCPALFLELQRSHVTYLKA